MCIKYLYIQDSQVTMLRGRCDIQRYSNNIFLNSLTDPKYITPIQCYDYFISVNVDSLVLTAKRDQSTLQPIANGI